MNSDKLVAALLALCVFVLVAIPAYAVYCQYQPRTATLAKTGEVVVVSRCNLPCKCAPLYDLGTDEWIECMGVGLVLPD